MIGKLAKESGFILPVKVCKSAAGYYLGTSSRNGDPISRESYGYWDIKEEAESALATNNWVQRFHP